MAWRTVNACEVRVGDWLRTGPGVGDFARVASVVEPDGDLGRAFELSTWREVGEDEVFEIDRPSDAVSAPCSEPVLGVEVEY